MSDLRDEIGLAVHEVDWERPLDTTDRILATIREALLSGPVLSAMRLEATKAPIVSSLVFGIWDGASEHDVMTAALDAAGIGGGDE